MRPFSKNNAVVKAAEGVVSATFGTICDFALYKYPPLPLSGQQKVFFQILGPWRCSCKGGGVIGHFGVTLVRVTGGGGGATPRVLGRQLPPPPPLGAFGQQLVAKGVALRRPWAPKAPDAP